MWVRRYNGPANRFDAAWQVAVSPGGGKVFVTGTSYAANGAGDFTTVAYNAVTGARLWVKRYNGPANGFDVATSVAVSPGGGKVFVTGSSFGASSGIDYATVAYSTVTGARLWVKRYNGPANSEDDPSSVAVSPGGKTVVVTGTSQGATSGGDYATVAYRAATGARLWVKRYNGPAKGLDAARSVAVSPGGKTVVVTGTSQGATSGGDYATVAYRAATGARLWVKRYNGPANDFDAATSVVISPGGKTVVVSGASSGTTSRQDYATVAYNAATGAQLWAARYDGTGGIDDATSVAISPSGDTAFVTGYSEGGTSGDDYATVAYNAATGAQLWAARYNGPSNLFDEATSVAVSPKGSTLFVTGISVGTTTGDDYTTVAYNTATGAQLWVKRYNGPGNGQDDASSVAVSPSGRRVFVTGTSAGPKARAGRHSGQDYATIAYSG